VRQGQFRPRCRARTGTGLVCILLSPGFTSSGMISVNSRKLPGQPCVINKGIAFLCFDFSWTKCRSIAFKGMVKWCKVLFRICSCLRQSYVVFQYCSNSCKTKIVFGKQHAKSDGDFCGWPAARAGTNMSDCFFLSTQPVCA